MEKTWKPTTAGILDIVVGIEEGVEGGTPALAFVVIYTDEFHASSIGQESERDGAYPGM